MDFLEDFPGLELHANRFNSAILSLGQILGRVAQLVLAL